MVTLIKALNSGKNQGTFATNTGNFPTKKTADVSGVEIPAYKVLLEQVAKRGAIDSGLTCPKYNEVRARLFPEVQAAILHKKTPEQALADFEAAAKQVLAAR
jgi:ABC-type glycerol-3-phosphate transport system substrate-binding protein